MPTSFFETAVAITQPPARPQLPRTCLEMAVTDFFGDLATYDRYMAGEAVATKHGLVQLESARAGEAG